MNQYLDTLAGANAGAGPTPQELEALNHIAALRAQGMTDAQIFGSAGGGQAGGDVTVGGGYGYLPYILQAAGITSSYNLGRGNLAANLQDSYYNRQSNPFQIVGALQQQRDTGAGVGDATIRNITPSQAPYQGYLDSLFQSGASGGSTAAPGALGGTAPAPAAPPLDPATIQRIRDAYARDPQAANAFFSMGNPHVAPYNPLAGGQTGAGVYTAYPQGSQTAIPGGEQVTQIPSGPGSAQGAAAQLIGGATSRIGMAQNQFRGTLAQGKVPGFGSINEADFGKLTPDQRAAYFGLVGSTGAVSDPAAAYADYAKKYSQGGLGGGGSYR